MSHRKPLLKTKKSLKVVEKQAEGLDEDLTLKESEAKEAWDLYHKTEKELDELKEGEGDGSLKRLGGIFEFCVQKAGDKVCGLK